MPYSSNFGFAERGLHADAQSWYSRVLANGGTVDNRTLRAVDEFCRGVNGDGVNSIASIRSYIKSLNLFAGNNMAAAQVPLIADSGLSVWTKAGTVTHRNLGASRGVTGDGSTGYFDTGVSDTVFTNGVGAIAVFLTQPWVLGVNQQLIGNTTSGISAGSATQVDYGVRAMWNYATTSPRPVGTYAAEFVNTNALAIRDGSGAILGNVGFGGAAAVNQNLYVCARNSGAGADRFSAATIGAVAVLDSVTSSAWNMVEQAVIIALHTALRAFHSKLGW